MILERTADGKALARTKAGYREGRLPYKKAAIDNVMELLKPHTYKEVVEITGINQVTLARYKRKEKTKMYRPTKLPPMPKGVTDPSIWRGMWCNGILTLPEGMTQEEVDKKLWEGDKEFLDKYSKPVGGLDPNID